MMSDLVEIAKALASSKPLATAAIVIAGMLIFRKPFTGILEGPITRFIDRIRRFGFGKGRVVDANTKLQQQPTALAEAKPSAAEVFQLMFPNELISTREANIRSALEARNVPVGAEREKFLTKLVAMVDVAWSFELTYRAIYGTQIAALSSMNSAAMEPEALRQFYDFGVAASPQFYENYTFEQWLDFMLNNGLAERTPTGSIAITNQGREFLKFITGRGYPIGKPG
jgi:hypothetical protein